MTEHKPILVGIADAAKIIHRSRATIYNMIASGELRAKKHGRSTLIPADQLSRWANDLEDVQPKLAS